MTRYHLSTDGNPRVCTATKNCPYGDLNEDHYDSKEEARKSYEEFEESLNAIFAPSKYSHDEARQLVEDNNVEELLNLLDEHNVFLNHTSLVSDLADDFPNLEVRAKAAKTFGDIYVSGNSITNEERLRGMIECYGERLSPKFSKYGNNRVYIGYETEDHQPWANLTVNLPDVELAEDEVVLNANCPDKTMLSETKKMGFYYDTGRAVKSGFVTYPIVKLSADYLKLIKESE